MEAKIEHISIWVSFYLILQLEIFTNSLRVTSVNFNSLSVILLYSVIIEQLPQDAKLGTQAQHSLIYPKIRLSH